jgi:hypothetical protein
MWIRRADRYWLATAAVATSVAFIGFAPTYYLKSAFGTPALPILVHVHAAVFTAWLLVFGAQAWLVSARRISAHRALGTSAVLLIAAMTVVGTLAAIQSARAGLAPPGMDPLQFLVIPLGALGVFVGLATAGLVCRRDAAMHKRLMLLATLSLLTPALARFSFVAHRPPIAMGLTLVLVLAAAAWDWRASGGLHRAWAWGVGTIIVSIPLRLTIAHTEAWRDLASSLVR